jgi:hypothetical protein
MGGKPKMKTNLLVAGILSFALAGVGTAQGTISSAENGEHYTQAQLKQLANTAQTPEQYKALAGYYGDQQQKYLLKAAEEKKLWEQRNQITTSLYAKYPRPADSSRYRYEYFSAKATESASLAVKYSQLAQSPMLR